MSAGGQTVESDRYFNLSGVTYSASSFHLGTAGTNYYATTYGYDVNGTDGTPTDDSNQTTAYTYDGDDNMLTQTAVMPSGTPDQTTQYVYGVTTTGGSGINSNDVLAKVEYPDPTTGDASTAASNDVSYTTDALGEVIAKNDQNGTTHAYQYDVLGRQTSDSVTVASGNPEHINTSVMQLTTSYDSQGNVYQKTSLDGSGDAVNQILYVYNGLGQETGEYQAVTGTVSISTTPEVQYTYSDPGEGSLIVSMTYPNGRILHYGYDSGLNSAIGRLSFLADDNGSGGTGSHVQGYIYLGLGTVIGQTDGNGVTETTTLDQFGRTAEMKYVNSSSVTTDDFAYGYDQDGNVLYKKNLVNSSLSNFYTYDDLNRVTSYEQGTLNSGDTAITGTPSASQSWTYDALGNQLVVTTNGTAATNTVNSQNELTGVGSSSLSSDNNGNQTTDQNGNTLVYDAWNRLISDSSGTTTLASYTYDAAGRQATQTNGATTTDLYYSNQWQVLEERQAGTTTTQYVWSPTFVDEMVLRDDNSTSGNLGISGSGLGERIYAQNDANYNVTSLVDSTGTVLQRYVYDPYGSAATLNASWASTTDAYNWIYMYQGGRIDATSGLYNFRNREYSPEAAKWLQQDPAGYVDGTNLYQYEQSESPDRVDPMGLKTTLYVWRPHDAYFLKDASLINKLPPPLSVDNFFDLFKVESSVGHAALMVNGEYISWWPHSHTQLASPHWANDTLDRDIAEEGYSWYFTVDVTCLYEDKIINWWNGFKNNKNNDAWNLVIRNCAEVADQGLKAGGVNVGPHITPVGLLDEVTKLPNAGPDTMVIPPRPKYYPLYLG